MHEQLVEHSNENVTFSIIYMCLVLLEIIVIPIYIRSIVKQKKHKVKKMICSSSMLASGIIAPLAFWQGYNTAAVIAIVGLAFSWVGDLLLSSKSKGRSLVLGMLSFLLTHICYIASFTLSLIQLENNFKIVWYEYLIVVGLIALACIIKFAAKINLGKMTAPLIVYVAAISCMLARAVHLAATVNLIANSFVIVFAAIMFLVSDFILAFIIFKNKSNFLTETINIITYYLAQLFITVFIAFSSIFYPNV